MMQRFMLTLGLAATLAAAVGPDTALAHRRHRYEHHASYRSCAAQHRRSANIGAVAGAIGGGIIGSALTHGRVGGTLLGAGAGAFTGHEIGKNVDRC